MINDKPPSPLGTDYAQPSARRFCMLRCQRSPYLLLPLAAANNWSAPGAKFIIYHLSFVN